ncbi:hypothetical protein A2U01_0102975, partial [Trifolium medium]|nr:hypothetical protein [Trifolium medium]
MMSSFFLLNYTDVLHDETTDP